MEEVQNRKWSWRQREKWTVAGVKACEKVQHVVIQNTSGGQCNSAFQTAVRLPAVVREGVHESLFFQ
jgi:hypothetical protein